MATGKRRDEGKGFHLAIDSRRDFGGKSSMNPVRVEDKLALNKYEVDEEAHIRLKEEICQGCKLRVCLYVCPAECYKLREDKISFSHEGCLECGTCQISCDRGAIEWSYPRGGFGVSLRYG